MFLKNFYHSKNAALTAQQINLLGNSLARRLFSSSVPSTETAKLDNLYAKIEVEVRGNDPAVLKSYGIFSVTAASHLGITVGRNAPSKKYSCERFTVLKSAFVHKKHRVQYEMRTHYRYIDFLKLTGSTADTILEYIQRNLPEGVAMKVTKHEITPLIEGIRRSEQNV